METPSVRIRQAVGRWTLNFFWSWINGNVIVQTPELEHSKSLNFFWSWINGNFAGFFAVILRPVLWTSSEVELMERGLFMEHWTSLKSPNLFRSWSFERQKMTPLMSFWVGFCVSDKRYQRRLALIDGSKTACYNCFIARVSNPDSSHSLGN